jgi:hypothetical protein
MESALTRLRAASFPAYPRFAGQIDLPRPEGNVASSADFMQGQIQVIHILLSALPVCSDLVAAELHLSKGLHMPTDRPSIWWGNAGTGSRDGKQDTNHGVNHRV